MWHPVRNWRTKQLRKTASNAQLIIRLEGHVLFQGDIVMEWRYNSNPDVIEIDIPPNALAGF